MWKLQDQPWANLQALAMGRSAPRAHFYPFATAAQARTGDRTASDRVHCLNGDWQFRWLPSPLMADHRVVEEPADAAHGYAAIRVPCSWQFAGYGSMLYTDEAFPFPIDPPHIPAENETGVYKRSFCAPEGRSFLRFEGVESAFALYINGVPAGYSQGSRMPSEFEITTCLRPGPNDLCVVVYQYCDGSYLEDQDMWWLGGIIRDVLLIERPQSYLADLVCEADYDPAAGEGLLTVRAAVAGEAAVHLALADPQGRSVAEAAVPSGGRVSLRVPGALAWNAEQPHLYQLLVTVCQGERVLEATQQRLGFRRVEIAQGVLLLNGRRIMLRGVNRHEFDPHHGRAVSEELTARELLLVKRAGMNAVRTSHYPNIPAFYDLCDRLGLYVIDECDLETHGFEIEGDPNRLADDPAWTAAYLERAERMVARDRNHACIVMWSLGNESSYGENFAAMYRLIKAADPGRPVHYEPDTHCASADVSSSMYTPVGSLHERDVELDPRRPHILCEFGHAMGNGPGSLAQYIETCEHSERIQGYFVWELKDHGVYTRRSDGTVCYRYGGDFGEDYTSGNFCMDGLLFADGTPSPGYYEYRRLLAPIRIDIAEPDAGIIRLSNRWDFAGLEDAELCGELRRDGQLIRSWTQALPAIAARETREVALSGDAPAGLLSNALWTLTLTCRLTRPTVWAEAGHALGSAHGVLRAYTPQARPPAGPMRIAWAPDRINLSSARCSLAVSLIDGSLLNYTVEGVPRLTRGPALNFFRAYLDNDRKLSGVWQAQHLHSLRMTLHTAEATELPDITRVTLTGTFAPNARNWRARVVITYDLDASGHIRAHFAGRFEGDRGSAVPVELPKLGTKSYLPKALNQVTYCGLGPGESYCDSKTTARLGIYTADVESLQVRYERPQDNGNRTGVDFVAVTNGDGEGLVLASLTPRDMSIRPQEDKDLWHARHACDVPDRDYHVLHFDMRNSGLGSGSCGPNHLAQHAVFSRPFDFAFAIAPVGPGEVIGQARAALDFLQAREEEGR
ncbi:MAG: DUF4981 domain-containing protein [Oscillospiraceae bacterium]|jgi:beta-galactosidase/evolved beta-galactosidase subunit alpha|nr:DUF4981 domain-containing protein [Oscillospiraceae bacterium]